MEGIQEPKEGWSRRNR